MLLDPRPSQLHGDSLYINGGIDRVLPSYADAVNAIRFYAGGRDLADPLISPSMEEPQIEQAR